MNTVSTIKQEKCFNSAGDKRQYNRDMFGVVAPRYDFVTRALSLGRDRAWKKKLIAALPDLDRPECLDLACGTGDIAFLLAKRYPRGHVIGLDLTELMIELARRRPDADRVDFCLGDMMQIEREDGSTDIVTGGYALRNAPDLKATLKEIHRVLRPGGTAAFLDFSRSDREWRRRLQYVLLRCWCGFWSLVLHGRDEVYRYIPESLSHFPDRRELAEQIHAAGFDQIQSKLFMGGHVALITFRKK